MRKIEIMVANGVRRTLHFPSSSAKTLFIRSLVTSSASKAANFAGISFSKPSFASSRFLPRRLTFSKFASKSKPNKLYGGYLRVLVELVGGVSVTPLHSITVSTLHTSLLSLSNQNWGCLSEGCYTPLHVAAKLGHEGFVNEILNGNPFLAEMQDLEGMCPLHLAAANGHLEAAKALVLVNREVTLLKDKQGRNPLHVAAIRAGLEVIKELIVLGKSEAVFDRKPRNETVFHLCVKHFRLEARTLLLESVDNVNLPEFTNLKDDDSFTVLHLAVAERNVKVSK